ncbi:hypothetical protein, partial [Escherichia coli]|uniref:hypothetical protein n=1 Tax=Escherichia coli TaxID=562 RepID=UPI003C30904C
VSHARPQGDGPPDRRAIRHPLPSGAGGAGLAGARPPLDPGVRGASGRGWWFRTDGPDVAIEPSVHIDGGLTRRSLQIVVRGSARTDSESKIRWKLSPAGASGEPS